MNEEKIKEQAKRIMDEFVNALEKVKEEKGEVGFESEDNTRKPHGREEDDFRELMLDNAPKKKDSFVVAEKKKW